MNVEERLSMVREAAKRNRDFSYLLQKRLLGQHPTPETESANSNVSLDDIPLFTLSLATLQDIGSILEESNKVLDGIAQEL